MSNASSVDELLDSVADVDLDAQPITWRRERWHKLEEDHSDVLDRIDNEVGSHGTIRRSWLRSLADEPMVLLVASMIWGFGSHPWGPFKLQRMLREPRTDTPVGDVVANIVAESQRSCGAGFTALFDQHRHTRVKELGVVFGTKLVHFAGYDASPKPRPLVYDLRVWSATERLEDCPTFPTPKNNFVATADYERYCDWAGSVAAGRDIEPAMVEYALFCLGGELKRKQEGD